MSKLLDRMDQFLPGLLGSAETHLLYQVLEGRVFTLIKGRDDLVSHGEVPTDVLAELTGEELKEGWYDEAGRFLGEDPPKFFFLKDL